MRRVRAFLLGVREFRSTCTTGYDDYGVLCVYDMGRELAHRVTLRRFDPNPPRRRKVWRGKTTC